MGWARVVSSALAEAAAWAEKRFCPRGSHWTTVGGGAQTKVAVLVTTHQRAGWGAGELRELAQRFMDGLDERRDTQSPDTSRPHIRPYKKPFEPIGTLRGEFVKEPLSTLHDVEARKLQHGYPLALQVKYHAHITQIPCSNFVWFT